jgi:hypothetical protein
MLVCEEPGRLGLSTVLNGCYLISDCCVLSVCERCVREGLSSIPAEALDGSVVARTPTHVFVQCIEANKRVDLNTICYSKLYSTHQGTYMTCLLYLRDLSIATHRFLGHG